MPSIFYRSAAVSTSSWETFILRRAVATSSDFLFSLVVPHLHLLHLRNSPFWLVVLMTLPFFPPLTDVECGCPSCSHFSVSRWLLLAPRGTLFKTGVIHFFLAFSCQEFKSFNLFKVGESAHLSYFLRKQRGLQMEIRITTQKGLR